MSSALNRPLLLFFSLFILLTLVNFIFLHDRLGNVASWVSVFFAMGLAILIGLIPRAISLLEHKSFMRYYIGFIAIFGGITCAALLGYYALNAVPIYYYLLVVHIVLFLVWILLYFYFR